MVRTEHEGFWSLVDKRGPIPQDSPELGRCWLWRGAHNAKGEPVYHLGRRVRVPHRYAWKLAHDGKLPNVTLGSLCWRPGCVRPDHRAPGVVWRARLTKCKYQHKFTKENTNVRPDGKRQCRKCSARRVREMYARQREAREQALAAAS